MSSTDNYDKTMGLIFVLLAFIVIMTIFVAAFFLYARLCLGFGVETGYPLKDDDFSFFKNGFPTSAGHNQTFSKSFTYHIASTPMPSPAHVKLLNLLSEAQPISTPKLLLNTNNRNENAYAVNIPTIKANEIVHDMEFFEIDSEVASVSMSSAQSGVNWFHAIKDKIMKPQTYEKCKDSETSETSFEEINEYVPRRITQRAIECTKTIGRIRRQLKNEFDFTISTL